MLLASVSVMPNLHQDQPILSAGLPLSEARAAMVMLHGRGATAESILSLATEFDVEGFTYLAPQAANSTWYPYRFLEPVERNEPWLSSALQVVADLCARLAETGIPPQRIMLLGFSQGACLTLEYAARHARRFGGIVGLSGGLIGPSISPHTYSGSLAGTPVFLGCSDVDFHIPLARVHESAALLRQLGGSVTEQIYPGLDHTINQDEVKQVKQMMNNL